MEIRLSQLIDKLSMKAIIVPILVLLPACSYIVKRNQEYERQLPTRLIMLDVEDEERGKNQPLAGQSWNQYWRERIKQLKKIDEEELINLIVTERRKRGLPEIH
jgi:hypothetical protein